MMLLYNLLTIKHINIKNEAKKKNIEQIALIVYEGNFQAINCYKKNGFTHRLNSQMICRIK